MREYDLIADWYAQARTAPAGVPEVLALLASLPQNARVLDAGCGTGRPITEAILATGRSVVGVDSSPRMVERFRQSFPNVPVVCSPIQTAALGARPFDAIVAWGVLFHLHHDEQRRAIAKLASLLKPGGVLLFTAADQHDAHEGVMNGVTFPYYSFSVDEYRELLGAEALTLERTFSDAGDNFYYLARKAANDVS